MPANIPLYFLFLSLPRPLLSTCTPSSPNVTVLSAWLPRRHCDLPHFATDFGATSQASKEARPASGVEITKKVFQTASKAVEAVAAKAPPTTTSKSGEGKVPHGGGGEPSFKVDVKKVALGTSPKEEPHVKKSLSGGGETDDGVRVICLEDPGTGLVREVFVTDDRVPTKGTASGLKEERQLRPTKSETRLEGGFTEKSIRDQDVTRLELSRSREKLVPLAEQTPPEGGAYRKGAGGAVAAQFWPPTTGKGAAPTKSGGDTMQEETVGPADTSTPRPAGRGPGGFTARQSGPYTKEYTYQVRNVCLRGSSCTKEKGL